MTPLLLVPMVRVVTLVRRVKMDKHRVGWRILKNSSWMWHLGLTRSVGWVLMFCTRPNEASWIGRLDVGGDPKAEACTKVAALY